MIGARRCLWWWASQRGHGLQTLQDGADPVRCDLGLPALVRFQAQLGQRQQGERPLS